MAGELHTYRCSFCKTVATTPVKSSSPRDVKCVTCLRWMGYLFSQTIDTLELQALADRGLVYNPHVSTDVIRKRCDTCKTLVDKAAMVNLGVGGRYCSQPCADIGTEKHRATMEAIDARLEKLYQERPWLRPSAKETA